MPERPIETVPSTIHTDAHRPWDATLVECIRQAWSETAFLAKEKHALEKRFKTCNSTRTDVSKDPSFPAKAKAKLDRITKELDGECERKRKLVHQSRAKMAEKFQESATRAFSLDPTVIKASLEHKMDGCYKPILQEYDNELSRIRHLISEMRNEKMDQQEKAMISSSLSESRKNFLNVQQRQYDKIEADNKQLLEVLKNNFQTVKTDIDSEHVKNHVLPKVRSAMKDMLDPDWRMQVELQIKEVEGALHAKSNHTKEASLSWDEAAIPPSTITSTVKDAWEASLKTSEQPVISAVLQEITAAQATADILENRFRSHRLTATLTRLQKEVQEQQTMVNELQDMMKELVQTDNPVTPDDADARVSRLKLSRDVLLVDRGLDLATNLIAQKISKLRSSTDQVSTQQGLLGKRPRVNPSMNKTSKLQHRLDFMEFKLCELERALQPFKDTILTPSFPGKLDASYKHLWDVASNHQQLLAALSDPVAASSGKTVDIDLQAKTDPDELQSLPLMHAIQRIAEDTAAKTIRPLQDKLALLESRLNNSG